MGEIDIVRCRLSKISQEEFCAPSDTDRWEAPTVVMKFIRRVPAVTQRIMGRFKDHYNVLAHLLARPNGVHTGVGT